MHELHVIAGQRHTMTKGKEEESTRPAAAT